MFPQKSPFCPLFGPFYPHFASPSALRAAGASRYPAPKFPRVNEHPPAHRRSAWATRGLASHTKLPKMVGTVPTSIVYDKIAGVLRGALEGKRDCTGRASRTLRLLAAPGGPAPPCRFRLTGIQAMRARSSRATKSVCSGEFRPCWTMANTALTSPRIKAAGSSQRPGNTVLRRMPSASGLRGL